MGKPSKPTERGARGPENLAQSAREKSRSQRKPEAAGWKSNHRLESHFWPAEKSLSRQQVDKTLPSLSRGGGQGDGRRNGFSASGHEEEKDNWVARTETGTGKQLI